MWHTVIVTATEWENFWNLRATPTRSQSPARRRDDALGGLEPADLGEEEWHLHSSAPRGPRAGRLRSRT